MAITDTDIGFLIAKRLMASASVGAMVGDRIRPDTIDPNEVMPAIRYEAVQSGPWPRLNDPPKESLTRLQIDCYGTTRLEANAAADAAENNLSGFSGELGSVLVFDCTLDNKFDRTDPPASGSKHWRKRRTLDFVIAHTTPVPDLT